MRLVVVGGVAAGMSAASRARRVDPGLEIVVLEKGERIAYGACGLPYLIEGQVKSVAALEAHSQEFFERQRDIRVRTGAEVISVRHSSREVVLKSGERLHYDKLVWAAGARPAQRFTDGKVFTLHTDLDGEALKQFIGEHHPRSAAVVGGGYIGLETATALRAQGLKVTLFNARTDLLNREDPWLTGLLKRKLEECGVEVHLNQPVSDPAALPFDLVLAATGLKPNIEAIADAGVEVGRTGALRVSDRQETSLGGVWAAGDCCETRHLVSGVNVWIPLGTTANKTGRVAGANAAGKLERFEGIVGTSIVRAAGLSIATTGLSAAQARREGLRPISAEITDMNRLDYFHPRRLWIQLVADSMNGRLLGGAVVGEDDASGRINVLAAALQARMKVSALEHLDLAYAPPYATVTDPLLTAARQLAKLLD
ncbi:MAG TPA: FAD-dependent oxidoreductase [Bryobacteraceae bacterium]|nr:FAD-dependent oxidoreductase [Bryobacteraceae bacterium]HPT26567.1 FAD-dependent oxidoreductase [Bryobacteraceae bacterium]